VGDGVIKANVVVINRIAPDCAKTKRDGLAILPPDEITRQSSGSISVVFTKTFALPRRKKKRNTPAGAGRVLCSAARLEFKTRSRLETSAEIPSVACQYFTQRILSLSAL
jgi:hypothetical protein